MRMNSLGTYGDLGHFKKESETRFPINVRHTKLHASATGEVAGGMDMDEPLHLLAETRCRTSLLTFP